MASVNKVTILGNLGADPEIKSFQNGGKIANLRIATSESWKDKQSGEKKERTEWHTVSIQGDGLVGVAERYLKKGSKVYLEGQLRTRKWQDQSGADRYSTEIVVGMRGQIVMLDGKQDGARSQGGDGSRGHAAASAGGWGRGTADDLDDDIPFVTCGGVW